MRQAIACARAFGRALLGTPVIHYRGTPATAGSYAIGSTSKSAQIGRDNTPPYYANTNKFRLLPLIQPLRSSTCKSKGKARAAAKFIFAVPCRNRPPRTTTTAMPTALMRGWWQNARHDEEPAVSRNGRPRACVRGRQMAARQRTGRESPAISRHQRQTGVRMGRRGAQNRREERRARPEPAFVPSTRLRHRQFWAAGPHELPK